MRPGRLRVACSVNASLASQENPSHDAKHTEDDEGAGQKPRRPDGDADLNGSPVLGHERYSCWMASMMPAMAWMTSHATTMAIMMVPIPSTLVRP